MNEMNWNWANPEHDDYRADLTDAIEKVTRQITWEDQAWDAPLEPDDIRTELLVFVYSRPTLLNTKSSAVFAILHRHAKDVCLRTRKQAGAVLLGRDALGTILRGWNGMPAYVWDVVHGPTFSKAAGGRYLELLTQVYRDACNPFLMSKADQKAILRALDRLIEVLADVMCGRPESFDITKHDREDQAHALDAPEDDETFYGHQGTYSCAEGHEMTTRLAVKAPKALGMERVYGLRNCSCGKSLALAA